MRRQSNRFMGSLWLPSLLAVAAGGTQPIPVPNGSFESPATLFAGVFIDAWQEFPKPPDYDESGPFSWDQLAGTFKNTPPGSADHIINCDGHQAAFLFALPGVGIFQDYESRDWNDPEPTHAFNVRFENGKSYRLTAGIIGGGGNMLEGATLALGFIYRDDAGQRQVAAMTTVTNSPALTPGRTNLVDFSVVLPRVHSTHPWSGRHLGIQIWSTVPSGLEGGYWDVEHVRLESLGEPEVILSYSVDGNDLVISWDSQVDTGYQLEGTTDLLRWAPAGDPLPGTGGRLSQRVPMALAAPVLYRVSVLGYP